MARAEQVQLIPQRDLAVARGTRVDSATSTPTGRPELPIPRTSSDTESQRDLASTYVKLGEVAMNAGKLDEAQGWFARAITVRQSLAVDHPGDVELQRDLAITYTKQGEVAMVGRRLDDARVWFIKALTVHEAIATEQHTTPLVADSGTKWGSPWALKNNDALSEDAVAAVTRVQPSNPEQYDLAVSYKKLGDVELSAGNFDAARDWYKEASDIAEKVANPGDIWWQRERVVLCKQLGVVEVNAGDLGAAHDWYAQAYTIVEQVGAANPSDIWWRRELVVLSRQLDDVAVGAAPDGPEISGEIEGRFDGFQK